jgi:DNA-binding MarR family transcriptional regulator
MPRFKETISIDDYVLDVLMRDIVGHDQQPAAFLVYLFLYGRAARQRWQPVKASLRMLADETGLSKSTVQAALAKLHCRELIATSRHHQTAVPSHRVLRHWRQRRKRRRRLAQ